MRCPGRERRRCARFMSCLGWAPAEQTGSLRSEYQRFWWGVESRKQRWRGREGRQRRRPVPGVMRRRLLLWTSGAQSHWRHPGGNGKLIPGLPHLGAEGAGRAISFHLPLAEGCSRGHQFPQPRPPGKEESPSCWQRDAFACPGLVKAASATLSLHA